MNAKEAAELTTKSNNDQSFEIDRCVDNLYKKCKYYISCSAKEGLYYTNIRWITIIDRTLEARLFRDLISQKVAQKLIDEKYEIEFFTYTGWFWNKKPVYSDGFKIIWKTTIIDKENIK